MAGKGGTRLMTISAHNVQSAVRHAGILCRTRQPVTAERIKFGRFHNTGIAGGQRSGDTARCHLDRIVPWNDLGRHAERFINREIQIVLAKRDRPAFQCFSLVAIIFEIARGPFDFDHRFPIGLARFKGQHGGDLFEILQQICPHPVNHAAPFNRAHRGQHARGMAGHGRLDASIDVSRISKSDLGKGLARARIINTKAASTAIYPFAVHIILPIGLDLVGHVLSPCLPQYSVGRRGTPLIT